MFSNQSPGFDNATINDACRVNDFGRSFLMTFSLRKTIGALYTAVVFLISNTEFIIVLYS